MTFQTLIKELATYERSPNGPKLKPEDLLRDGFGDHPRFTCLLAENEGQPIGFITFHVKYGWVGKGLYLTDLYVSPTFRGQKLGSKLFRALAKEAITEKCNSLDINVFGWNPAGKFYEAQGCVNKYVLENTQCYRMDRAAIQQLADHDRERSESTSFRFANKTDIPNILTMMKKLAAHLKKPGEIKVTAQDLLRDGFELQPPLFHILIAEKNGFTVGYTQFYYTYSTWEGPCMYLADFFVMPAFRKVKIGSEMLKTIAQLCRDENVTRLDFSIFGWNTDAEQFYKAHGAINITEKEEWHRYKLDRNGLEALAN